tara:strand:+ start:1669 stop:2136 length:468 start_codon:yes stop_codon:yes gene_type:complete
MWTGLKLIFAGLKLTKARAFGVFSILGTIVTIYFLWAGNANKKNTIQALSSNIEFLEFNISQLQSENFKQNSVIMKCSQATQSLKDLAAATAERAAAENLVRELDTQKRNILREHNEQKIKNLLAKEKFINNFISSDTAELFNKAYADLQSTRDN